ncbi:MAG: FecR domain-containing protein [Oscillospiraceae bacterium]|nr:FecR domain-containing protein [Oscillospiraceae bacterium]
MMKKLMLWCCAILGAALVLTGCGAAQNADPAPAPQTDAPAATDVVTETPAPAVYRSLQLYHHDGDVLVLRRGQALPLSDTLLLHDGDVVITDGDSRAYLMLDDDKFLLVEGGAVASFFTAGTAEKGSASVSLLRGGVSVQMDNPPAADSPLTVVTADAEVQAVEGAFRAVAAKAQGAVRTLLQVASGSVSARAVGSDKALTLAEGDAFFLTADGGSLHTQAPTAAELKTYADAYAAAFTGSADPAPSGQPSGGSAAPAAAPANPAKPDTPAAPVTPDFPSGGTVPVKSYTVTFRYNGQTFGTQTVRRGDKAVQPALQPAAKGAWDFDFTKPITDDTVIDWK